MTQGYCYVFTPGFPYKNTADGISGSETPLHACMSQNREITTISHNLILLIPMMPSGTTGDANEGSPQIPHSFERHTTVFV